MHKVLTTESHHAHRYIPVGVVAFECHREWDLSPPVIATLGILRKPHSPSGAQGVSRRYSELRSAARLLFLLVVILTQAGFELGAGYEAVAENQAVLD